MGLFRKLKGLSIESTIPKRVFLGGTCNGTTWREQIIPHLGVPYFNPVVTGREWTEGDKENELYERGHLCSHMLYVITPKSKGLYAIAELVEDSMRKPDRTIVCFLKEDGENKFDDQQWSSIESVMELVRKYHDSVYTDLQSVIDRLNKDLYGII